MEKEIQQSYLEIFDSDGDRGSKDDDGKDAMQNRSNQLLGLLFQLGLHDGHFFHINDKSQIVISNVANYGRFQV